jgi:glycosyltransferase involved in cell wall biosynthesis
MIGLAMLVRDEEDTVFEALNNAAKVVETVTIVDTGSKDSTREIVRDCLRMMPGELHEREWRGFGPNRTELLALAQGSADYHLMLDADHKLHVEGERPELTADSYMIRVRDDGGRLPLLTRDGHPFEYRGVAHSYLASDVPTRTEQTDWLSIDGGPGASVEKLQRDRDLLEKAFLADTSDRRTVFYLAQTYRDLDMVAEAIRFYRLRAEMGGWDEEVYWARHQLGCLLCEHVAFSAGAPELLKAWQARPSRNEALRALANAANSVADKTAVPDDVLFVRRGAYL